MSRILLAHNGVDDGHPNETGQVQAAETINTTIPDPTATTTKSSSSSTLIIVIVVAVVLAGAAFGAWKLLKRKKSATANPAAVPLAPSSPAQPTPPAATPPVSTPAPEAAPEQPATPGETPPQTPTI